MTLALPGPRIRLLFLAALATLLTSCLARRTWPPEQDTLRTAVLGDPVDIRFDALGVPHVQAASRQDLAYAVGYLHARDRGFQLEMIRHAAQGRLTELFGDDLLEVDRRLRLLTIHLDAAVENLPAEDLARLEAYCAGVNEGRAVLPRPLELKLLGFEPEPWSPKDVMAVGRLQAWDLSVNAGREAIRDRIRAAVAGDDGTLPERYAMLTAPAPHLGAGIVQPDPDRWPDPATLPSPPEGEPLLDVVSSPDAGAGVGLGVGLGADANAAESAAATSPESARSALAGAIAWARRDRDRGSNGYALAGSRTADGEAILVGDPHIALPWPPMFYEVHLSAPDLDVSGATFPGMPMVVIGRGDHVAWTLTTSYADTQDLYRLEVHPEDPGRYRVDGAWRDFERHPQRFVLEDEVVEEDYRVSIFGPVYNPGREDVLLEGAVYALSWPGFSAEPLPLVTGFEAVAAAPSVERFVAGVQSLPIPSQSWVFAMDTGDIGWVLGGTLPNSRASLLPRDGTRSDAGPQGPGLDAARPMLVNPPSGVIVASNQPIGPDPELLNAYFSGSYRALRVNHVLHSRDDWTPRDLRGLQVDLVNLEAHRLTPVLLAAVEGASLGNREARMVALLRDWDATMEAESAAPLVYETWRGALHRELGRLHLDDSDLRERWMRYRISEGAMDVAVFGEDPDDDPDRWWPGEPGGRDAAIRRALTEAAGTLEERWGAPVEELAWGDAHQLQPEHPFASKAVLRPLFGIDPIPTDGGRHTVCMLDHYALLGEYAVASGPALRQVVVPGKEAGFVLPGGNAGQPRHPHALDQLPHWLENRQHRAAVMPEASEVRVRLEPAS